MRFFVLLLIWVIWTGCRQSTGPPVGETNQKTTSSVHLISQSMASASAWIRENPDSALHYAQRAAAQLEYLEDDSVRNQIYLLLGEIYLAKGDYIRTMDYYLKTKGLLEEDLAKPSFPDAFHRQYIAVLKKIGVAYFYQQKYQPALEHYERALEWQERWKKGKADDEYRRERTRLMNNIAGVHLQMGRYDSALEYYQTAADLNAIRPDSVIASSIWNNMGICHMEKQQFDIAMHYLQKSLAMRESMKDGRGIVQCYNSLGKCQVYRGDFRQASRYFQSALALGQNLGWKESIKISLESLSSVYDTLRDYQQAYHTFKAFTAVRDSLFNNEIADRITQLEIQYEREKQQKLFDLEQKKSAAESAKKMMFFYLIGGALLCLTIILFLVSNLWKMKFSNARLEAEKWELEHQHLNLEKIKLQEALAYKTRELTTNVMYLLKKNEWITSISEKLIKARHLMKGDQQKWLQDIIYELRANRDHDTWEAFETHFTQVHTDFYKRLGDRFPHLTANERKLCAFLRLNMSTKDISAITYQSVNSISVARSRLRKKLQIEGEDVHLVNFLMNF